MRSRFRTAPTTILTERTCAMTIAERTWATPSLPHPSASIPIANGRFGSWEFALRRRIRTAGDLAGLYDDASESWARTSRRFRLETTYRNPLLASGATKMLAARDARILDCGIGSGSLSLALASLTTASPDYHGIDTSAAMLAAADAELRRAGIVAELRQSDIRTIPHPDRSVRRRDGGARTRTPPRTAGRAQ